MKYNWESEILVLFVRFINGNANGTRVYVVADIGKRQPVDNSRELD